jgi:hypothetical protein
MARVKDKKEVSAAVRLRRLLNYKAIVKQVPFFLFLALLAVIYNGHLADKTARDMAATQKELKELQYEYKDVKGDVLKRSTQTEMTRAVEPLGLKELTEAPAVLVDSSRVNEEE